MEQFHFYIYPKEPKAFILQNICIPGFTVALFIIVKIWKQLELPINRQVDIKVTGHICKGILLDHKNEILPIATDWMDLKGITLSEVSQSETNTI